VRLIRISLLIALFALALPATAQATFQSLGRVSDAGQTAQAPQVGVDQNGNAVFVWARFDGTDAGGQCCHRIEARTRTATGTLSPVQTLSAAGKNASQPQVAVAPNGTAVITWVLDNGTNDIVQARRRTAAGVLTVIQPLSAAGQDAEEPQAAMDANGNAIFVWERLDGSAADCCLRIQTRRWPAAAGLSATQTLSNAGEIAYSPQVGVDTNGNAVYSWTAFAANKSNIQARARTASGTLSALQTVSSGGSSQPQIAVAPNGNSVISWVKVATVDVIQGRARTAAGGLSAIQTLSAAGQYSEEPQVAIDANGNAIFIWERLDSTSGDCCWRIETRTRTAAGVLGTTEIHSAAGQTALAPQVGFDSSGNAYLVWGRFDGTNPGAQCCFLIQTRRRSSSGTLTAVQTLSVSGQNASTPQIAVDPGGNAVYAWARSDGTYGRIQARRRATSGTLSLPQTLSAVGPGATQPQVAVDPNGNSIFTWVAFNGTRNSIQARSRTSAGALAGIQTLSDTTQNATQPQVGIDSAGNSLFVWKRFDASSGTCCNRIQARRRSSTAALGTVETLSDPGQNADAPQLAVDPNGNSIFTWTVFDGTNQRVQARARSATGTLSAVETLSAAGQNATEPQVGIDSSANAVFTWKRSDGVNTRIEAIARSAAGTLSAVQLLSLAGQNASTPQLAVVPSSGNAVFTWMRFDGTKNRTETRTRTAAGALSPVQPLSAPGENASQPQVGVDPAGNAVYAWTRFDGSSPGTGCCFRVQSRRRTAAGVLSPIQFVSPAGDHSGLPQIAVDSAGNAVIVWRFDGANKRVEARTRTAAGALGPVQFLSLAGFNADVPQVAMNATGKALATWQLFDGKKSRAEGAVGP